MRLLLLFLLAAPQEANTKEGPEPGPVPARAVRIGELRVILQAGDAHAALKAFVAAHEAHKKNRIDEALAGYVRFLGIPGSKDLPARYTATVKARIADARANVKVRYEKALKQYAEDRQKGLKEFRILAARYGSLPEGYAAQKMWHTDGLFDAITSARAAQGKAKKAAAAELEAAIKGFPDGVYGYEAKSLLIDLGGPDLFLPGERVTDEDDDG